MVRDNKYFYYEFGLGFFYIIGRVIKDCKRIYKYELIKSNYKHNPNSKYHIIWKDNPQQSVFSPIGESRYKWFDNIDDLMVEMI